MAKLKKIIPYIFIGFILVLLILGYLFKDNLNGYISGEMQKQTSLESKTSVEKQIRSKYNYDENGVNYDFTFLEFGADNCAMCKQMEPVLAEVKNLDEPKVNVVFIHIMNPKNVSLIKYYGISAVPMQVLLDSRGKVFYRHYGFISTADLKAKFAEYLSNKLH